MTQVFLILFAAAFTAAVSMLAGRALLGALKIRLLWEEQWFFGFLAGGALLSTIVFALTAAGLAYGSTFLAAGILLATIGWLKRPSEEQKKLPPLPRGWKIGFLVVYAVFGFLYLKNALAPEASPDGAVQHVALPALYLREHAFPRMPNLMDNMSQGLEMLFLFAFAFGKHSATAMVHLLFTFATPLGMLCYARRSGFPQAGVVGSLLFFVSPLVAVDGSSAYVDVALGCLLFAVFYALEVWRETGDHRLFALAGLLAGFAYAVKYSGAVAIVFAAAYAAFFLWRSPRRLVRAQLAIGLFAVFCMAPWMLKNWIVLGNPVSPLASKYFPNPNVSPQVETAYKYSLANLNSVKLAEMPLEVTVHGGRLNGLIGPIFLLTPLVLLGLGRPAARRLLAASAVYLLPSVASIDARWLIFSLPCISMALALALIRWPPLAIAVILAHSVLSWPSILARYTGPAWKLPHVTWRSVFRMEPEAWSLNRRLDQYGIGLALEKNVPADQPVFSFEATQSAYHTRKIVVSWESSMGRRLEDAIVAGLEDQSTVQRHEYRFPERAVARMRLVETESSAADEWSVGELRVFRQGAEIPRSSGWRLRAWPNPWDVPLAFDNNPVTRWSTLQPYRPGMFVELDFEKPERIDSVVAECSPNQSKMRLEFDDGSGTWQIVSAESTITNATGAAHSVRERAAADYLKQNGILWVLIPDAGIYGHPFEMRKEKWGMKAIAASNGATLYHLE